MYYIYLFAILYTYTLSFFIDNFLPKDDLFQYTSMALYLVMVIWYFIRNRKKSIFCPEIIIFSLGFIITFYDVLVLNNMTFVRSFFFQFSDKAGRKATSLSMMGYDIFIVGQELAKKHFARKINLKKDKGTLNVVHSVSTFATPMHLIVSIIIALVFISGQYKGFMKYVYEESEQANMINITISVFLMVSTVVEFIKLSKSNSITWKFVSFLKKVNKIYLFNVVIWSLFLLLTGNRGDMMVIALPPMILYFFFIQKVNNKIVLFGALIGMFIMVMIGLTRHGYNEYDEVSGNYGPFFIFRDYGSAYVSQGGLIEYTDTHGKYGLCYGLKSIASSVPFLGGMILGDKKKSGRTGKTNELTKELFLAANAEGGMGTNLLGDLYYAGGVPFTLFYMFILGWFLSYAYERLFNGYSLNIVSLFIYCWIFSDCLYIVRAPYYVLFRQIGFSLIIFYILYILSKKNPVKRANSF